MTTIVIRCSACRLNQYMTKNRMCRRCNKLLILLPPIPLLPPASPVPQEQVASQNPVDNVWEIAKRITAYRTELGYTQADVSWGMSHSFLSKVEGGHPPSISYIERLADRLGIPVVWLLEPITEERLAECFAVRVLRETRELDEQHRRFVMNGVLKLFQDQGLRRTG